LATHLDDKQDGHFEKQLRYLASLVQWWES